MTVSIWYSLKVEEIRVDVAISEYYLMKGTRVWDILYYKNIKHTKMKIYVRLTTFCANMSFHRFPET